MHKNIDTVVKIEKTFTSKHVTDKIQEEAEIKLVTEDPTKISKIANPSFAVQQAAIDSFTRIWWKIR